MEESLYGETGYVPLSNGDLDVVYGNVVNYDAKIRDDGGVDCTLEIVSKNVLLLLALIIASSGVNFINLPFVFVPTRITVGATLLS